MCGRSWASGSRWPFNFILITLAARLAGLHQIVEFQGAIWPPWPIKWPDSLKLPLSMALSGHRVRLNVRVGASPALSIRRATKIKLDFRHADSTISTAHPPCVEGVTRPLSIEGGFSCKIRSLPSVRNLQRLPPLGPLGEPAAIIFSPTVAWPEF